jgi:hypothetical protein
VGHKTSPCTTTFNDLLYFPFDRCNDYNCSCPILLLTSPLIRFLFVTVGYKYLNFATFSKYLSTSYLYVKVSPFILVMRHTLSFLIIYLQINLLTSISQSLCASLWYVGCYHIMVHLVVADGRGSLHI